MRLADAQDGIAAREQILALGFSVEQIKYRLAHGRLSPIYQNVYAVGRRRIPADARLYAALLSLGPRAFLSHRTALAVHGLRALNVRCIELTVPGRSRADRESLTIHRTRRVHPDDLRTRGHLRCSSTMRALIEVAERETLAELNRLITVAIQRRLLRPDTNDGRVSIEAALSRHPRHPGMPKLTAALAVYRRTDDRTSELERAFDRLLAENPDIPQPLRNVHIDGWEIDCLWPEHKLVLELDGRPYHMTADAMERDRHKDTALQRLGFIPMRVTDSRFAREPAAVLGDLRHFLHARRG